MASEADERANVRGIVSGIRNAVGIHTAVMVLIGATAGYGIVLLGTDIVSLPGIGPVPGPVVGVIGLSAAAVAYRTVGCCGDCGSVKFGRSDGCGCSDDCENSCSYDP